MISCSLSRNAFRPWDRESWVQPHEPGSLVRDYLPPDVGDVIAYRNSAKASLEDCVGRDDSLSFVARPRGGTIVGGFLINVALGLAVGFIISKLFPPPRLAGPKQRDDEASPTYSFNGISSNRSEGLPISVLYGEMRVGGTIIGEYVINTTNNPVRTELNTLICFGEGPVHSIGGVEEDNSPADPFGGVGNPDLPTGIIIDGNSSENYGGIEGHVRLGTQEQLAVPGFEATRQSFGVDQKLTAPTSGLASTFAYTIALNGSEFDATNDAYWDEHGVAFDLNVEDVDEFIVRVKFANGYFRQEPTDGSIQPAYFAMQVRYRELDSGGTPITTGGPIGDGYVRLPITPLTPFSKRSLFEWEYRSPFFDKSNFVIPSLGNCAALGTGKSIGADIDTFPHAQGALMPGFALSLWFRVQSDTLPASPSVGDYAHIAGDYDHATFTGWSLGLTFVVLTHQQNPDIFKWNLTVEYGTGTERKNFIVDALYPGVEEGIWEHVVVNYKNQATGPGTANYIALYRNGVPLFAVNPPANISMRTTRNNYFALSFNPLGLDTTDRNFRIDDLHLYSARISAAHAIQLYGSGKGTSAIIVPEICVANYNWDQAVAGLVNNAAPISGGQWYGDMVVKSGAPVIGSIAGVVTAATSGTFKKGQFRVEAIRINRESIAAAVSNVADFDILTSVISSTLTYPNLALLGLSIPATDQLNTSIPNITALVKGQLCPVWDGEDEEEPNIIHRWSQNPAWIVLDLLTNKRYGLGQFYEAKDVILPDLLNWANYCEETVYDGGLQFVMGDSQDDVRYTATTTDPDTGEVRGSLKFELLPSNFSNESPPTNWKVGNRFHLTGFPSTGTGFGNDINHDTGAPDGFAGYEITDISHNGSHWLITCFWDRTDEQDPWASGTRISDTMALDGQNFGDFTAVLAGGQPRFAFNGVFDAHRRAWDAILEVCSVGRGMPIRQGRRLRIKFNSPRAAAGVIGLGSIIEGTFSVSYGGLAHRPNVIEVSILDEDRNFESTTIEARADELNPTNVGNVRKETQTLFGVTNRHQAERHARFQVRVNELLQRTASWEMGANGLEYEPGDVVRLAHDILPRGTSGRVWSSNTAGVQDRITIDRDFTLAGGFDYNVYLHSAGDIVSSAAIDLVATPPGDYSPGDELILLTALDTPPQQDDVFLIVKDGSELLMEITNVTLRADMSKTIDAIEYNELVFADENNSPDGEQESMQAGDGLSDLGGTLTDPVFETTLAEPVTDLGISDRFIRTGPGQFGLVIHAGWIAAAQDRPHIKQTEIWMRERDITVSLPASGQSVDPVGGDQQISGLWRLVATVAGSEEFGEFPIPQGLVGRTVDIAISPVKQSGVRRRPETCAIASTVIQGFGPHPSAVVDFDAELRAQKVVYSWTPTPGEEDSLVELRRTSYEDPVVAGWILAPVAYRGLPGDADSPPIRDWAGSTILGKTRILSRTVNPLGHKSDLGAHPFNPSPTLDSFDPSILDDDVNWSAYSVGGTKWLPGAPAVDGPLVVDLAETGTYPDNILSFTGSSLTGKWIGAHDAFETAGVAQFRRPREYYVEAVLVAEQVHPQILDGDAGIGDLGYERWTLEGPTHLRLGEENCTLLIQARFNIDGTGTGWENWQNFRPGTYTFVQIQFRILVTRPTTEFDLKIHKLETRITAPSQGIESRPPYTAALEREFFD